MLKSDLADVVNSAGRYASPLTGAAFVSLALPSDNPPPWVHLDIAGVADTDKELPYHGKGATGYGVRTLLHWVESKAAAR
jgi:leucyl aminopeptidase